MNDPIQSSNRKRKKISKKINHIHFVKIIPHIDILFLIKHLYGKYKNSIVD